MPLPRIKGFLSLTDYLKLYEGGNAVSARPMSQEETKAVYDYTQKNIFPLLGLDGEGIDAAVIGSYGKKPPEMTSGDVDVAISADVVAAKNGLPLDNKDLLTFVDKTLKAKGYETSVGWGFNQVSVSVQIPGTKDFGQVDLMLSTNLDWSKFMYHSPDFTKAESKYKGLYRNILLMSVISESSSKVEKEFEGETEEYSAYVVRLDKGIFKVRKSFMGKSGKLVKTAKLLKEYDKFITNTPEEVVKLAFGENVVPGDIGTFESIWAKVMAKDFIHKELREKIIKKFHSGLSKSGFPFPTEAVEAYPNIFK
jgi:hypothetical protein